jgi:UDPglucose 6-dehydrogenase
MIGTGYVGLVNGACLADMGNNVTCIDLNEDKINMLKNDVIPIYEPGLDEIIARNSKANRLHFSNNYDSIALSDVTFIAVGTPPKEDGSADLKYVLSAARDFAKQMKYSNKEYQVIVTKSTVPVGTSKIVLNEILNVLTEMGLTHKFDSIGIASNPEFLKEGSAINDCTKPDRIVIGTIDDRSKNILKRLYEPFVLNGNNIIFTDITSSEMIKYASNSMLATRISFMNEIANLCTEVGANVDDVRKGMGADMRIGNKFLYPGCGYGGSCFPKDVRALIKTAEENGLEMKIIKAVEEVNESQKHVLFKKLSTIEGFNLEGKTIAILGLAFKPETDDMREAPSLVFINDLFNNVKDVKIRAYDPISMNVCKKNIDKDIYYAKDMYDAIKGADAIVLITEWKEFRNPDWDMISRIMNGNIVIDGRNIYTSTIPNTFFYKRIG